MIRNTRRLALVAAAATALALLIGGAALPATAEPAVEAAKPSVPKPTIVLVHGAFADSSGWSVVGTALQAEGYPVIAFSNPLRGLTV